MIAIHRPAAVPPILLSKGRELCEAHISEHANGIIAFDFERTVYGDPEVKSTLRIAQHDKCGFCEAKVTHVAFGDVEHFRPKAAFRALPGDDLTKPGYYWLAYDWTNLLFACEQCNRRHKGNLFPLVDETTRVRSHSDDLAREVPLFIDPTAEDPTTHIGFREEYPYPISGSPRGSATIRALGLDRPELVERRRERLKKIRLLRDAARLLQRKRDQQSKALAREIEDDLQRSVANEAEFAAAVRCAFAATTGRPRAPRTTKASPRASSAGRR
jgi:uncharacterized protein (TIGR02646 family)